jgi:3-oxoacyl-(acyl-carrier-protein) synthase
MTKVLYIQREVRLEARKVYVDDVLLFEDEAADTDLAFLGKLYRHLNLSYPKFFKMDPLSKTLFLVSELLLQDTGLSSEAGDSGVAQVFQNGHASLYTDRQFQSTIHSRDYLPGPSLFVYTLANMALGEVAIRHKCMGESVTFMGSKFDTESCIHYVSAVFERDPVHTVLCGWFDYTADEQAEARIFLVRKEKNNKIFKNIKNL